MNRLTGLVIAGLMLMLGVAQSWGGPPNPTDSDANGNTAGGSGALLNVTTGTVNTGFGSSALFFNTTGNNNSACGANALEQNITGSRNTASGSGALASNTTANNNTASGTVALANNTTGGSNTASGTFALAQNTTGSFNTANGASALVDNTTGSKNTALGFNALGLSTGNQNIAVGHAAGLALTSGNKNIYLGHPGLQSESKTMRLGNAQTRAFITGVATATILGTPVEITAEGQLGIAPSSARYKRDIETMGSRSEGVLQLRPVTFAYRDDKQAVTHFGLVAEEVATVYPDLVTRTTTGEVQTVRYQELIPMLVNELQRQHAAVERQERELAELRHTVERLRATGVVAER